MTVDKVNVIRARLKQLRIGKRAMLKSVERILSLRLKIEYS